MLQTTSLDAAVQNLLADPLSSDNASSRHAGQSCDDQAGRIVVQPAPDRVQVSHSLLTTRRTVQQVRPGNEAESTTTHLRLFNVRAPKLDAIPFPSTSRVVLAISEKLTETMVVRGKESS